MCVYIACLVVSSAFQDESYFPDPSKEIGTQVVNRIGDNDLNILRAIPIFIFCFCGHPSVCSVANELQNLTVARMDTVLAMGVLAAGILYASVCYAAYSSFGNATPKDLLGTFPQSVFVTAARLGMTVVCVAFYALLVNPVRAVLLGWVAACSPPLASQGLLEGDGNTKEFGKISGAWHWVMTTIIAAISLGTALATQDLGKVFSLSGATGFALLCHVCPAVLYLKVVTQATKRMQILAGSLGLFGICVIPVCVAANLL
jgi:amino acid permease